MTQIGEVSDDYVPFGFLGSGQDVTVVGVNHRALEAKACSERKRAGAYFVTGRPLSLKRGQLFGRHQHLDCARLTRDALDQPLFFQPNDHLVHGRRRHAKVPLKLGF